VKREIDKTRKEAAREVEEVLKSLTSFCGREYENLLQNEGLYFINFKMKAEVSKNGYLVDYVLGKAIRNQEYKSFRSVEFSAF
jgi:hypothetical protein